MRQISASDRPCSRKLTLRRRSSCDEMVQEWDGLLDDWHAALSRAEAAEATLKQMQLVLERTRRLEPFLWAVEHGCVSGDMNSWPQVRELVGLLREVTAAIEQ